MEMKFVIERLTKHLVGIFVGPVNQQIVSFYDTTSKMFPYNRQVATF